MEIAMNLIAALALWWYVQNHYLQSLLLEMRADSRYCVGYNDQTRRFYYLVGPEDWSARGWSFCTIGVCQMAVFIPDSRGGRVDRVQERLMELLVARCRQTWGPEPEGPKAMQEAMAHA